MSAMLKATFRCMKHLWVHPNAKSGFKILKVSVVLVEDPMCLT